MTFNELFLFFLATCTGGKARPAFLSHGLFVNSGHARIKHTNYSLPIQNQYRSYNVKNNTKIIRGAGLCLVAPVPPYKGS